jgi:hypothetical protein
LGLRLREASRSRASDSLWEGGGTLPGQPDPLENGDEFGQYTLALKCSECGHERTAEPRTLQGFAAEM